MSAVVLGGWLGVPAVGAQAQAAEPDCTFTYDLSLSPGIGKKASSGPLRTDGNNGRYECRSGFGGETGFDGTYGSAGPVTCSSGGEGAGTLTYRVGFEDHQENVRFTFGAIRDGKVSGAFEGSSYTGRYTFTATEGTCAAAITQGRLVGEVSRK